MDSREELRGAIDRLERARNALKRIYDRLPTAPYPNGHSSLMLSARCATCGTVWMAPAAMVGPEGYLDCCPNDPGQPPPPAGMRTMRTMVTTEPGVTIETRGDN